MLLIKSLGEELAKTMKIDWNNPRVVCIAEAYSKFDIDTVEVVPMRIELFKYRFYENGIFSLEPLGASEQKSRSNSHVSIEKPIVDNSVDRLLAKGSPALNKFFEIIRSRIVELDENITEKATSIYIGYRVTKNFAEIYITKKYLKILLRPIEYDDPKGMVEKISDSYGWTLNRRVNLKNAGELEYVFSLIEQSYKDVL